MVKPLSLDRPAETPAPPSDAPALPERCEYRNAEGRRCGMLRARFHTALCPYHAEQEQRAQNPPADNLLPELLGPLQDFRTGTAVNYTLGRLLLLLASKRISTREAAVMAYVCQLLLQSVTKVRHEIGVAKCTRYGEEDLRKVLADTITLLKKDGYGKGRN